MIFNPLFNKSGTTSLTSSMMRLGYSTLKFVAPCEFFHGRKMIDVMIENDKAGRKLMHGMESYDFYSDFLPIYHKKYIPLLDEQYPGSKFIITVREMESWLDSRERHIERNKRNPSYDGYWMDHDCDLSRRLRIEMEKEILDYFSGRDCLLLMDICAGDGWDKLCGFLGKDIPAEEFPFQNIGGL